MAALDLQDPQIREGQRIALEVIRQVHQLALRNGIRFIVLLLSTKELVISEQAKALDSSNYHALIRNEPHAIEYIYSLPALQAGLQEGDQPYHVNYDGHPNEVGHRVIAEAVRSYLHRSN